jgi:hypothetical protein
MGPELDARIQTFTPMTKRRLFAFVFLVAGILLLVAGFVVFRDSMTPIEPGVTEANFNRIMVGMTLGEVQQVMGNAGHEFNVDVDAQGWRFFDWFGEDGYVDCTLDHDGCVFHKAWIENEPILQKLASWLHLQ